MPGGQFTNLKEQARSLGLGSRWNEIATTYRRVNDMLGDIVKVTPSSKVVGDMALMMVSQGITREDVLDPDKDIAFPASMVEMLRGELGQPAGGWPVDLQMKVLNGPADRAHCCPPQISLRSWRRPRRRAGTSSTTTNSPPT